MSSLLLVPYLLWLIYHSYVAFQKRSAKPSGTPDSPLAIAARAKRPSLHTAQSNPPASANDPSFDDRDDYADADRGFIGALEPGVIRSPNGKVVWDVDKYAFLKQQPESLPTVHPNLVRQGQLSIKQGLYRVAEGIYQVRALDISNMTILEGTRGIVVIDPLVSIECAKACVELYYTHRGWRPVTALIFSHSHADHYLGAEGALQASKEHAPPSASNLKSCISSTTTGIPILAPEGFLEAAVSEHVLAGPAMLKRSLFMYGMALPTNPRGIVGAGLGLGASFGTKSILVPTLLIKKTGEEHTVDGVHIEFQMVPDTEAPAEMNFFFPATGVLLISETATNCMHNIVTLRGAKVRDAKAWSLYLDEAISLYGARTNVLIGSHNWPMWGRERVIERLGVQRDLYGFLHDQTVRLMNEGLNGTEAAEVLESCVPPAISRAWYCRGFYGSLNHNVKGIYQRYLTWFDGDPAHLWKYPAREEGRRYVDCIGGVVAVNKKAEEYIARGDSRFAVTLLAHVIAANKNPVKAKASEEPYEHKDVLRTKQLLVTAYENLGFGAENATWRNFFLTGALELRTGLDFKSRIPSRSVLEPNLPVEQWFNILSVQLNSGRAVSRQAALVIDVEVDDELKAEDKKWRLIVSNGVLTRRKCSALQTPVEKANLSLRTTRAQLRAVLQGESPDIEYDGDFGALQQLLDLLAI